MKKIIAFLLLLAMTVSLLSCSTTEEKKPEGDTTILDEEVTGGVETEPVEEPESDGITPLLYKVTDSDGDALWLFGSIHVGTEDYYPLPDYVMNAFEESDALAVEFDIVAYENDTAAQISSIQQLVYTDGTTISDHISDEVYTKAVEIMEENDVYNSMFDYYIPAMWESMIQQCVMLQLDVDTNLGVDRHLIDKAYETEKKVLDIESADFQLGMLADFSPELQELLLKESVEGYNDLEEYSKELELLMKYWMSGDEEGFKDYLTEDPPEDPEELKLYDEYNKALMYDRNDSMTEYAVDALNKGKELFICVGAAHVMGETGMVEQLRELGYTVDIVK